jgi:transposase-like protein
MNTATLINKPITRKRMTGQSRPIVCNDCGNHWTHIDGSGFRSAIYYCDLCANRKSLFQDRTNNLGFLNPENINPCKCGGSFTMNATIRCPQCKSTDLEISSQQTLWD